MSNNRKQRKKFGHCAIPNCEGTRVTKHHIIPRREFGREYAENIIYLCNEHHDLADNEWYDREYLADLALSKRSQPRRIKTV